ncbi:MAG: hypothetical protein WKF71_01440 [Pyrinomonadaceae bacterium]
MNRSAIFIILAIFVVAILYSSVGHGGASGYLAVMAFFSIAPTVTRPTALLLNVFVASIAFFNFTAPNILIGKYFCRSPQLRFRLPLSAE